MFNALTLSSPENCHYDRIFYCIQLILWAKLSTMYRTFVVKSAFLWIWLAEIIHLFNVQNIRDPSVSVLRLTCFLYELKRYFSLSSHSLFSFWLLLLYGLTVRRRKWDEDEIISIHQIESKDSYRRWGSIAPQQDSERTWVHPVSCYWLFPIVYKTSRNDSAQKLA